jgi:hypothetical protein
MPRLYLKASCPLEFKWLFPHLEHTTAYARFMLNQEAAMFLRFPDPEQLAILAAQVRVADEATPNMFSEIVATTCQKSVSPRETASIDRIHRLIEADALTQAAMALIELKLPQWKLRRIIYDDGEWHCAMSQQRELPEWLDQAIEVRHANLTLAMVSAYVETIRQIEALREPARPSVPQIRAKQYEPLCCDNFA